MTLSASSRSILIAAFVLWLAASLLIFASGLLHMHSDEDLSYRATNGTLGDTIYYQQSLQDNQAPLWFVTFWGWRQLVGDAEWSSRVLGVFLTLPALAIAYRMGRTWFGEFAAVSTVLIAVTNAFFITYAMDIRPYPMVMFVTAISFWAFDRWLIRPKPRSAAIYGVSLALMLYVHYLLVFVITAQALYLLASRRLNRRTLIQGIGAGVLAFVLWLPWFPTFLTQFFGLRNLEAVSGTGRGIGGIGVSTKPTTPETIIDLIYTMGNGVIWLYGIMLIIGVILLWRMRRFWLAITWALLVPAIYLGVNLFSGVYAQRYVAHAMIGIGLALGAVIAALPKRIRWTALAGVIAVNIIVLPLQIPPRTPFRDVLGAMEIHAGDVIYLDHASEGDQSYTGYQLRNYLAPGYEVVWDHDFARAESTRRVWYITADWFNEDVRATFAALEPTHPVQQVVGKCDRQYCFLAQLMEAPPLSEPIQFGERMLFWGADVDPSSPDGINVRLWWRVEQAPERDYSIGLQLLDESGRLVAQSDGAIQNYGLETIQTSSLEPGRLYIDHRTLSLPTDRIDGAYTLALVVYQSWDNVRLEVDGVDSYIIDTITIQ